MSRELGGGEMGWTLWWDVERAEEVVSERWDRDAKRDPRWIGAGCDQF